MKCRKCGSELDSDSVFCPECGTRVERPVENNSGDIVRDNVNSGTTADIPKQTKRKYFTQNCDSHIDRNYIKECCV